MFFYEVHWEQRNNYYMFKSDMAVSLLFCARSYCTSWFLSNLQNFLVSQVWFWRKQLLAVYNVTLLPCQSHILWLYILSNSCSFGIEVDPIQNYVSYGFHFLSTQFFSNYQQAENKSMHSWSLVLNINSKHNTYHIGAIVLVIEHQSRHHVTNIMNNRWVNKHTFSSETVTCI